MNTHDKIKLPKLPEPVYSRWVDGVPAITLAEHAAILGQYARAAIEADRKRRGKPVAAEIERLAANRYRPVPDGVFTYKVVAGDGCRSLFSGTKNECYVVALKLTEAFLDGAFLAENSAPQPAEPVKKRKAFICPNCEGVYADQPVSQCDCVPDKNEFIEGTISYPATQPAEPEETP